MQKKLYDSEEIWKSYFKCRFHTLSDMSKEYLRTFGVNVTGIDEYDNDFKNDWTTTYLNIDSMLEKYRRNVPLKIVSPDDAAIVYEIIQQHLLRWRTRIDSTKNNARAPLEDLNDLDRFADSLFPKVANTILYSGPSIQTEFDAMFKDPGTLSTDVPMGRVIDNYEDLADDAPERESLSDYFKKRMGNSRWK
jgi:hypothetical protein